MSRLVAGDDVQKLLVAGELKQRYDLNVDVAQQLAETFGRMDAIEAASKDELTAVHGVGDVTAEIVLGDRSPGGQLQSDRLRDWSDSADPNAIVPVYTDSEGVLRHIDEREEDEA